MASLPPFHRDVNRGPMLLCILWVEASIATLVVALRMFCRISLVGKTGMDDHTMVATLVISLICTSLDTKAITTGMGRHAFYLTNEQIVTSLKYEWISHAFAITSVVLGKVSYSIFLLRISDTKHRRWFLGTIYIVMIGLFMPLLVFTYAQCTPTSRLWDLSVQGKCWDPNIQATYALVCGIYGSVTDLVLAIYPINILINLQLPKKTKIGLGGVMCLGVFAAVCAAVKTRYLRLLTARSDFTFDQTSLIIWYTTEMYVIIIAASIPPLRPLMIKTMDRSRTYSSRKRNRRTDSEGAKSSGHTLTPYPKGSSGGSRILRSGTTHVGTGSIDGPYKQLSSKVRPETDSETGILSPEDIRKTTEVVLQYETNEDPSVHAAVAHGNGTHDWELGHDGRHYPRNSHIDAV